MWALVRSLAAYERLEHRVTGSAERLASDLFAPRPLIECLVAEEAGTLAGYALFHPIYSSFRTEPMMWLEDLYVEPAHRGKGLGLELLLGVAKEAEARGCWRLSWAVLDGNQPSIRFYESFGAVRGEGGWHVYQFERPTLRALAAGEVPGASRDPG